MNINFSISLLIALIPLAIGMIWYSKMMFGNAWMKAAGINMEDGKKPKLALILIVAYIFSLMITMAMYPVVIHQMGVQSALMHYPVNDSSTPVGMYFADFMNKYGHEFRTFKHGALHGSLAAIFIALPVTGTSAIFEKKGFAYIAIHTGYWIVSLALVGGAVCAFA